MKQLSLLRGLVFALIAGLGLPCYALLVAPTLRRGVVALLLSAALVAPVALVDPGPRVVFVLTPFVLGIVRSAILFPRPLARALFLELCVSGLALALSAFFQDASLVGETFAVWAFWLVQAGFALAPGEAQPAQENEGDAFEDARARALAVLERGGARAARGGFSPSAQSERPGH